MRKKKAPAPFLMPAVRKVMGADTGGLAAPDWLVDQIVRDYENELKAMVAGLAPTSGNPFAGLRATLRSATESEDIVHEWNAPFKFGDILVNRDDVHVMYIAGTNVFVLPDGKDNGGIGDIEGELISDWTVVEW